MQLYDGPRPNPRAVRMMMHEKGLKIPRVDLDIDGGENRRAPFVDRNPSGQVPVLVLDDGTALAESGAIMQYLEEKYPDPPLIGATAEERAVTRMWLRRIERRVTEPFYAAFHYGPAAAMYRSRMVILPDCVDGFKALMHDGLGWLDGQMEGRATIVPGRYTVADIALFAALDFAQSVGFSWSAGHTNLVSWFAAIAARPAARASLHPLAVARGRQC
ncbi:glutathione S-transferase family protein [Acidiferrobacter sp. SPIII_3]|uniref:glutathione S-transferase family protein n=1 Tax=Acidiferrobacter sp. SPIII_3 TaxID=1281578 RepID=UPI000D73EF01|nr:glutathione S-transferase family protein [Acidiferrobacter sp. SPIII_3]AWP22862.1 glutathione S-transferase family protein [Acidiferrobacter sp. SPIII_3]